MDNDSIVIIYNIYYSNQNLVNLKASKIDDVFSSKNDNKF